MYHPLVIDLIWFNEVSARTAKLCPPDLHALTKPRMDNTAGAKALHLFS